MAGKLIGRRGTFSEVRRRATSLAPGLKGHSVGADNAPAQPYGAPTTTVSAGVSSASLQSTINAAASSAVIGFDGGNYGAISFTPKSGQKYVATGSGGVPVFNGSSVSSPQAALTGTYSNCIFYGLKITGYYTGGYQLGAVVEGSGSSGNTYRYCSVVNNGRNPTVQGEGIAGGGGLKTRTGVTLDHCDVSSNSSLGWGTYENSHNITASYCLFAWNNSSTARAQNGVSGEFSPGTEGGAFKLVIGVGREITDCESHHNHGTGMWADIDNYNTNFRRNYVHHNTWEGIFYEIGGGGTCEDNLVEYNCWGDSGTGQPYGLAVTLTGVGPLRGDAPEDLAAGIQIVNSGGQDVVANLPYGGSSSGWPASPGDTLLIRRNTVRHCRNGLVLRQDGRTGWKLGRITSESNTFVDVYRCGLQDDYGLTVAPIVFTDNDYTTIREGALRYNAALSWAQWQSAGRDTTGSYTP